MAHNYGHEEKGMSYAYLVLCSQLKETCREVVLGGGKT